MPSRFYCPASASKCYKKETIQYVWSWLLMKLWGFCQLNFINRHTRFVFHNPLFTRFFFQLWAAPTFPVCNALWENSVLWQQKSTMFSSVCFEHASFCQFFCVNIWQSKNLLGVTVQHGAGTQRLCEVVHGSSDLSSRADGSPICRCLVITKRNGRLKIH